MRIHRVNLTAQRQELSGVSAISVILWPDHAVYDERPRLAEI